MPELAEAIAAVSTASQRLEAAQEEVDGARVELRRALRAAHEAGASYAFLARLIGTSRQYVTRVVSGDS